jgi:hypothetical protein
VPSSAGEHSDMRLPVEGELPDLPQEGGSACICACAHVTQPYHDKKRALPPSTSADVGLDASTDLARLTRLHKQLTPDHVPGLSEPGDWGNADRPTLLCSTCTGARTLHIQTGPFPLQMQPGDELLSVNGQVVVRTTYAETIGLLRMLRAEHAAVELKFGRT